MTENGKFGRIDSKRQFAETTYKVGLNKDAVWDASSTSTDGIGNHHSVQIRNYTGQELLIVTNPRMPAMRVSPQPWSGPHHGLRTGSVFVEIRFQENIHSDKGTVTLHKKLVNISIPGWYLEKNSLFIEELGWYMTVESRLEPTLALLRQDIMDSKADEVSVPQQIMTPNPRLVFSDFEPLARKCLDHADMIQVEVGPTPPETRKQRDAMLASMRICVLGHVIDPIVSGIAKVNNTLAPDEIRINNISREYAAPLHLRWNDLLHADEGILFVDGEEVETLQGMRCKMVIVRDRLALLHHFQTMDSKALYKKLSDRVIAHEGTVALQRKITQLEGKLQTQQDIIDGKDKTIEEERSRNKELHNRINDREETIRRIKQHQEERLDANVILMELENENLKVHNDRHRIHADREESQRKHSSTRSTARATMFKAVADGLKSFWGILVVVTPMVIAGVAWVKKNKPT